MYRRPTRLTHGFSLIELLVVISIVSLLIALLLPALTQARESADSVRCLANQRQMGVVWGMYLADYEAYMRTDPWKTNNTAFSWSYYSGAPYKMNGESSFWMLQYPEHLYPKGGFYYEYNGLEDLGYMSSIDAGYCSKSLGRDAYINMSVVGDILITDTPEVMPFWNAEWSDPGVGLGSFRYLGPGARPLGRSDWSGYVMERGPWPDGDEYNITPVLRDSGRMFNGVQMDNVWIGDDNLFIGIDPYEFDDIRQDKESAASVPLMGCPRVLSRNPLATSSDEVSLLPHYYNGQKNSSNSMNTLLTDGSAFSANKLTY